MANPPSSYVLRPASFELLRALDDDKDQSYMLHMLQQADLARLMFPLGEYAKPEVRAMVKTAEYTSEAGVDYLVKSLMRRREKIGTRDAPEDLAMRARSDARSDRIAVAPWIGPTRCRQSRAAT